MIDEVLRRLCGFSSQATGPGQFGLSFPRLSIADGCELNLTVGSQSRADAVVTIRDVGFRTCLNNRVASYSIIRGEQLVAVTSVDEVSHFVAILMPAMRDVRVGGFMDNFRVGAIAEATYGTTKWCCGIGRRWFGGVALFASNIEISGMFGHILERQRADWMLTAKTSLSRYDLSLALMPHVVRTAMSVDKWFSCNVQLGARSGVCCTIPLPVRVTFGVWNDAERRWSLEVEL